MRNLIRRHIATYNNNRHRISIAIICRVADKIASVWHVYIHGDDIRLQLFDDTRCIPSAAKPAILMSGSVTRMCASNSLAATESSTIRTYFLFHQISLFITSMIALIKTAFTMYASAPSMPRSRSSRDSSVTRTTGISLSFLSTRTLAVTFRHSFLACQRLRRVDPNSPVLACEKGVGAINRRSNDKAAFSRIVLRSVLEVVESSATRILRPSIAVSTSPDLCLVCTIAAETTRSGTWITRTKPAVTR